MQTVGLLPTALATGVVWFLLVSGAPVAALTLRTISVTVKSIGITGGAAILIVAGAVAITLQPLQFRLVQLLEGYWLPHGMEWLFRLGVWSQRRRRGRHQTHLVEPTRNSGTVSYSRRRTVEERMQAAESALRDRYPAEDRLLPTSLGNVLRSAEDRLGERYGLDPVVIWPRLFPLLPVPVAQGFDDEVTQLDVSVRLVTTWIATGLIAAGMLLTDVEGLRKNPEWLGIVGALFLLAWLSYRAALESALAHGQDIEVGLDLYRGRVVEAMRLPESACLSEERMQFAALGTLFTTYVLDETFDLDFGKPPATAASRAWTACWFRRRR